MLKYTGHPLVDVGVATIAAFIGKRDPTDLTEADLDKVADYMAREYVKQPLKSFLTVAFTSNAWFSQDAYNPDKPGLSTEEQEKRLQKREKWARHHLRQWPTEVVESDIERDIFTGMPAVSVELSGRLPPGRAGRAQVPLALGDEYINFYTNGIPGLPVSGKTILCLQAFPLGCAKCGGRLLAVHSDNDGLTFHFARAFLEGNRRAIQLAQAAGSPKMPEPQYAYRTLLVHTLLEASEMQCEARQEEHLFSLTAYHLTNSGQGVKLDIYHLPLEIIGFLRDMQTADYYQDWEAIVRRAWESAPEKKGGKKEGEKAFQPRRNWLYEDTFGLPDNAPRFLRTYFLRLALRYARGKTDPRANYSLQHEAGLVSWRITERFLRRIMHMDKERIEQTRTLGDRLAEYISSQNDRHLFANFRVQNYHQFRTALLRANLAQVKRGNPPVITFDPYIEVFEMAENDYRPDWRLARDLVLIRMIERLCEVGWLGANVDAVPEVSEEETESV